MSGLQVKKRGESRVFFAAPLQQGCTGTRPPNWGWRILSRRRLATSTQMASVMAVASADRRHRVGTVA
ncbi:hypothetical protein [Xanthomonas arboricola]|uniref:hypothetical protein n=1 Tax=Xanthomonas arboricola TaxID=56448 RepID=UPI0011B0F011|nr:hypothetical protein [Xanthomonas arboricola]